MLIEGIFLASFGGYYGGTFGNLLAQWEQLGIFSYVLPFLLIFALIFGLLQRMKVFGENSKAINAVIALSVGLMSLQFGFVPMFFSDIFPKLGVGLSVILTGIILTGLFTDSKLAWVGMALGGVVFFVVIGSSFEFGYTPLWFWVQQYMATIIAVGAILAILFGVVFGKPEFHPSIDSLYSQALGHQPRH